MVPACTSGITVPELIFEIRAEASGHTSDSPKYFTIAGEWNSMEEQIKDLPMITEKGRARRPH